MFVRIYNCALLLELLTNKHVILAFQLLLSKTCKLHCKIFVSFILFNVHQVTQMRYLPTWKRDSNLIMRCLFVLMIAAGNVTNGGRDQVNCACFGPVDIR